MIPLLNITFSFFVWIKSFKFKIGAIFAEKNCKESRRSLYKKKIVLSDLKIQKSAEEATFGHKCLKNYDEKLIEFKKFILKKIIKPLVKNYEKYNELNNSTDKDTSFQLESSFIIDHKINQVAYEEDRKVDLCKRLTKNISLDGMKLLKKISKCGWLFYQRGIVFHRITMFNLLVNYFNFLMPSYESEYLEPFDEFIRTGSYGISFEGQLSDANFYFYSNYFVKNDHSDPITAFLYLMIYCKTYCSGKLGSLCLDNLEFLN